MSNHCSGASSLGVSVAIPKAPSPVEDSMAELNNANFELNDAVATLHGRLDPVLMPAPPTGREDGQAMTGGCSPLVTELRERTEQVRAVTRRVKAITELLSI
ncbi:hypothetical protein [Stenotrophomonas acidaminiphila]|uniref:hypothetical protein n=1 Tax=Stenotrophomonas acidaminiphila TaxID=128780 RepID=UPI001FAF45B6|nr:hypothetical protein [Stenotrophomonas acidaminiphila]